MKNVCIIGYGAIGPIHADALKQVKSAKLYGICDNDPEALKRADGFDFVELYRIATVGIKEYIAVGIGVQIEIQRPRTPEKIDMSVGYTAASKVYKARKSPIVKHDIWQAEIAVNERIRA